MSRIRRLVTVLYLISIPGPQAWSQMARVVRIPAHSASGLPFLAAPLGGAPLAPVFSVAGLARTLSIGVSVVSPVAPVAAERDRVLLAAPRLAVAAAAAAEVVTRPREVASDRLRANFADGVRFKASQALAVLAAAPRRLSVLGLPRRLFVPAKDDLVKPEIPSPSSPPSAAPNLGGFLSGTFVVQLASNALQVTMPLLFIKFSGAATAGFAIAIGSAFDAAGTLLGGRLADRFHSKPVLLATTVARGLAVAALPVLAMTGVLDLPALAIAYAVECFARGIADTARNTLPSELAGQDEGLLKRIIATNQTYFEAGSMAGPFIAGALISKLGAVTSLSALWMAPIAFAVVALAYLGIPHVLIPSTGISRIGIATSTGKAKTMDGWMRWALLATATLTIYPLKGFLPAVFATKVLGDAASAAWLVGLFGVGGVLGSILYRRWHEKISSRHWLAAGGLGAASLAAAFLPGSFWPAALGVLIFAAGNVCARLALNVAIQTRAPPGQAGTAMGQARFTANVSGLGVRFFAGLAFAAAIAPALSFGVIAGGIAATGLVSWFAVSRLKSPDVLSAAHGMPGRLIVVEGLDGAGKSTQFERLKEHFESQGFKVVTTTWNSSDLVREAVKKAKRDKTLTPQTFALMNASDLADRLDKVVLPALREGSIVLADRWFYTALARDRVRGMKADWLRRLYAFAPKPDLVLYFRLPVETAIDRVLARSGELGLSEDFGEEESAKSAAELHGLKHYEAGLDARLSKDPVENFKLFQRRVTAEYEKHARRFRFKVIDSSRGSDEVFEDVKRITSQVLSSASGLKRAEDLPPKTNLFDKDPAGDAVNIRRNYAHPERGAHFYFRNMILPMQERFAELMDMAMPNVFLHGNPHIDNYVKSPQGAAMVDFDRSRLGPYAWDLVRLMVSLSLRRKKGVDGFLEPEVLAKLKKGYLHGFRHPDRPFSEVRQLKDVEPEDDEASTDAYLKANKKWAREMRLSPLHKDDVDVLKLVLDYARNQEPGLLEDYAIEEAGRGRGSMGFRKLYLVVLVPKDANNGRDRIFLTIKETRRDPDTQWYRNSYGTEIERMHAAAELYAPGWTLRPGSARLDGVEYDVRQISPQNVKIKSRLKLDQQKEFAYAVGTQLGRAHSLSLQDAKPDELESHLDQYSDRIVAAGATMRDEILDAHAHYLRKMKSAGLEPPGGAEDE